MKREEMLEFEVNQLLEAINFRYGYDFRDYARASIERRILNRVQLSDLNSVSEMLPKIMHDQAFFDLFLRDMSVTVTEMFREPSVFKVIREAVFTQLKTYSRVNIWHAGCATGEEVYSMAIMLKEEGLLDKTRLYATDYNNHSLEIAEKGIYPAQKIKLFTKNYLEAGGRGSFADYYLAKFNSAIMSDSLKKHITFANHNLMKDQCFAEMHLIVCRNVLIYFNRQLQNRVFQLFKESLIPRGFLLLGDKETLEFSTVADSFEHFSEKEKIYRRLIYV